MSVSLLVVGHGSREAAGNAEIEQFAAQWRMQQPHWHIEVCFIEFADVLLADGLSKAARHAGQTGGEKAKVVILPMMYLALSYDHRLIDGKEAVQFLVTIKELVENPAMLLLDL